MVMRMYTSMFFFSADFHTYKHSEICLQPFSGLDLIETANILVAVSKLWHMIFKFVIPFTDSIARWFINY